MEPLQVTERTVIPASELSWSASRASGPGGQNVNKVASKVDLRFDLPGTRCLSFAVKTRLRGLAANRLDKAGFLVMVSQVTRDQSRNLEDARQKLAELVRRALVQPKPRKKSKPSRGAKQRRLTAKKQRAETKQGRRKVGRDD